MVCHLTTYSTQNSRTEHILSPIEPVGPFSHSPSSSSYWREAQLAFEATTTFRRNHLLVLIKLLLTNRTSQPQTSWEQCNFRSPRCDSQKPQATLAQHTGPVLRTGVCRLVRVSLQGVLQRGHPSVGQCSFSMAQYQNATLAGTSSNKVMRRTSQFFLSTWESRW